MHVKLPPLWLARRYIYAAMAMVAALWCIGFAVVDAFR